MIIADKAKGTADNPLATWYRKDATGVTVDVNGSMSSGSDQMTYTPAQGWRYGWSVNTVEETRTTVTYGTAAWLGIDFLARDPNNIHSGPFTEIISGPELSEEGPYYYLDTLNGDAYSYLETSSTLSEVSNEIDHWTTSTWYGKKTYYSKWQTVTGTSNTHTHSVEADKPITVKFMGGEQGSVSINSTVAGADIILSGNIRNNSGSTSIISAGNIVQRSDNTSIGGKDIDLTATGNIGQTLAVNTDLSLPEYRYTSSDGSQTINRANVIKVSNDYYRYLGERAI